MSKAGKIMQAVLCCLLWSTAIPVLKIIYSELNLSGDDVYERIALAGIRFMISAVILLVFYLIKHKKFPVIESGSILNVALFGIINTTLQYILFYTGVMYTVAIKSVLLDGMKPLLVVLLAHFLRTDDRINIKKVAGLFLGFMGIIAANLSEFTGGQLNFSISFAGEGMLFLSSLAYAVAIIFGKKIMDKVHYLVLNIYQFFIGSAVLLMIGLLLGGFKLQFTPLAAVLLIYQGLLSAVVFIIWYRLISKYSPSSVTIYLFLIPVFGSIISSILFNEESITINVIISLILLIIGIVLVNYDKRASEKV